MLRFVMRVPIFALLLSSLFFPSAIFAEELPVFYKGVRPLGMGGAFTAVADDENAIFYNPAGLNNIEGWGGLEIFNPYVESTKNTWDFYQDLSDLEDAQTDSEQSALASELLDKWLGEAFHFRAGLFPNLTIHNFGVGVLAQGVFNGQVNNPLSENTLHVQARSDLALLASAGYGFNTPLGKLQIGATGKAIRREALDKDYRTADLVEEDGIDLSKDLEKGSGVGVDAGVIYWPPLLLKPSIGLTVQNVGDTDLGDAGELKQQINGGLALRIDFIPGKLLLAADMMDITRNIGTDEDTPKRIHAGAEYQFPLPLSFLTARAGVHQGYASAGLTFDFIFLKIAYAYYLEEIGAYAGQREDKRHILQLSLGF